MCPCYLFFIVIVTYIIFKLLPLLSLLSDDIPLGNKRKRVNYFQWRIFGKADWTVAHPCLEQKKYYMLLLPTVLTDTIQSTHATVWYT